MRSVSILALLSAAEAAIQGFNYGATFTNGAAKIQSDFEAEFKRAQTLQGTSGWSSARLYTMIQGGTANTPSTAIPAAINTKTGLLLGLWASAGQDVFNNEVAALKSAIQQYGSSFTDLIQGISIGSEDLYRITPTGIANKAGVGADPDTLVKYINQVKSAISGTSATGKIGHVDTWTAWTNSSNNAVISAVDWIGFDGYPYFQTVNSNGIDNAANLFRESYDATVAASQGKPVWVTETGWPVSGDVSGQAIASPQNAKTYWDQVGCSLFGKTNTWWYTLQDAAPQTPNPSFGIVGTDLNSAPIYDLSCPAIASSASSSAASASTSAGSPSAPASTATMTTADLNTTPVPISGSAQSLVSGTPVSAASSVSGTPMSAVTTITVTTMLPLESCPAVCANSPSALSSATTTMPPAGTASACPTNLNGDYQYPHLIVPVDSTKPNTALGTSYNGTINGNVRSIFNFDIPQSYAGKTCSLVFLFPKLDQLETSSYSFNNKGGLNIAQLSGTASQSTTFSNAPSISNGAFGSIPALQSGNGYVVGTGSCPAGQAVAYEFSSTGGLELNFFQDYNPSPLGAYITVC